MDVVRMGLLVVGWRLTSYTTLSLSARAREIA